MQYKDNTAYTSIRYDLQRQCEQEILSMIIGDTNNNKDAIIESLLPEMFTDGLNRDIFDVCRILKKAGKEVNVYSLTEFLGEPEYKDIIQAMYAQYITNVNWGYFANQLQQSFFDRSAKEAETLADLQKIEEIKASVTITNKMTPFCEGAEKLICEYYEEAETAVKTGYKLDNVIGSLRGGDLVILAAATGMGKTCFLLNLVKRIAENNYKIDIFSLEMPKKQLQNRYIAAELGINANKFRNFGLTKEEQSRYQEFAEKLKYLPINVCEEYRLDVEKIRQYCKKSDADVVFIDYLGLIQNKNGKSRYEKVSEISTLLKQTAMEVNKPFIVLHQLSREIEKRSDKTPQNSDLRDSGQIEQDADIILFLYRPGYYDTNIIQKEGSLIISKNRHGRSKVEFPMWFDLDSQKILDLSEVRK